MKKLSLLLFAVLLLHFACRKDTSPTAKNPADAKIAAIESRVVKAFANADALLADQESEVSNRANVTLPAGSVNGLSAAIAAAGPGGKVTVACGNHLESGTVEIIFPVKIVGQQGAVLEFTGLPAAVSAPGLTSLVPAFHVNGAADVKISGLEIKASGGGAICGILLQDAPGTKLLNNDLENFQFPVYVAGADDAKISNNTIEGLGAGFAGGFQYGITVAKGISVLIADNEVSQCGTGIFSCHKDGTVLRNILNSNIVGVLLCTSPPLFELPDGTISGAEESSNHYLVSKNETFDNTWGYLVIDGAFDNVLFKNNASNSVLYDIELAGETSRFGVPSPTSLNSTVISNGNLNYITIKDCAPGSVIIGGTLVDTNLDPCF
ncbi:MAG: right-handed parallel beta-helix repeat-containing protein [Saprospiraceae bacterium]|nr:right-handed parallel beta-helix repeat-containing protein [Saprospiraceae bacterium]